eukprot:29786-Pelagococcus_subviridis.AAC.2
MNRRLTRLYKLASSSSPRLPPRPFSLSLLRDLREHGLFADVHGAHRVQKRAVRLFPPRGLQVRSPVVQHRVDVHPVLGRQIERAPPVEQPHARVDRPVNQPRVQQDRLRLVRLPSEQRELRVPPLRARNLPRVAKETNLLHGFARGVGHLRGA